MPYIKDENKVAFEKLLKELSKVEITCAGELNYLFTLLRVRYLATHGLNYQSLNDIEGAATNSQLEWYRRVSSKYEDLKIPQNGDVLPNWLLDQIPE